MQGYSAISGSEISVLTQHCTVQMTLSDPSLKKCAVCIEHNTGIPKWSVWQKE